MSDFLDVLHVMFEESLNAPSEESLRAREHARKNIYTSLYGYKKYDWMTPESSSSSPSTIGEDMIPMDQVDPTQVKLTHKPYVPPTPVNSESALPYGNALDAPLG